MMPTLLPRHFFASDLALASPSHLLIPKNFWGTTWKKFRAATLELIRPGDRVLALVSGGPDSTALAYWLSLLSRRSNFHWAVLHFNHGLRPGTRLEGASVEKLADYLGVPFYLKRLDAAGEMDRLASGIEHACRSLRYQQAFKLAKTLKMNKVAAAHTLDEQAESVLLNIVRGGSLSGLLGARRIRPIAAGSNIMLIRPMLDILKEEVVRFLEDAGISYFSDPMNDDPRFLRSRIRHEILPKLKEFHPQALRHITGLASKFGVK